MMVRSHFNKKPNFSSYFILVAFVVSLFFQSAVAQVIVDFVPRTSYLTPNRTIYNIKGDFTLIGNKNLTLQSYFDTGNNSNNMIYVDVDENDATVNSSSAILEFSLENEANPECSNIIYAGLYWTGRAHGGASWAASPNTFTVSNPANGATVTLNKGIVKIKHSDAAGYTTVQASHSNHTGNLYYPSGMQGNMYSAYAEVTDYVREYGLGEYFVADIALMQGAVDNTGFYGGWGMIVVYENPAMNWRDVTIFDGHGYISSGIAHQLPVSGFRTVQQGPVNMKLGLMAGEGDRSVTGDYFEIRNANNTNWVRLSHSGNQINNFFNSSILTGGNPRNPNLLNNLGMDIVMFDVDNPGNSIIDNNQTTTTFRYGTDSDTYIIFCIAMAVDAYIPDTEAYHRVETIDGTPVEPGVDLEVTPGQLIEFSLELRNREQEDIEDFTVTIPIPFATSYHSSSAEFFEGIEGGNPSFDPTEGPTGSIIWNVGTLPQQDNASTLLARLTYFLEVSTDCFIISNQSCDLEVIVGGSSSGTGVTTGISFANIPLIQGYIIDEESDCDGSPITDPITLLIIRDDFINSNCQPIENYLTRNFDFCNLTGTQIPFGGITGNFPAGSRFYDSIDTDEVAPLPTSTEFTSGSSFPIVAGDQSYFAIPPGSTSCYWEFTISIGNLTVSEPTGDLIVCSEQSINIVHSTTGVTGLGAVNNLPAGVLANYSEGQILITGLPTQQGTFNYNIALDGECEGFVAEGTIVVQEPVTEGLIAADQTIGYNATPAPLTSVLGGTGSGELISYIWESSTEGPDTGFTVISSATDASYSPGPLTETTWFRRITVSTLNGIDCYSATTNAIQIIVQDIVTPGEIAQDQTICSGETPLPITSVVDGTGGGEVISYRWELSTESESSGFTEIPEETQPTLTRGPLTQTTWIRRITLSTLNGNVSESPPSNVVQITVQVVEPATIQESQTICNGETPELILGELPTGVTGDIGYFWEWSTTNDIDGFSPIPNQTEQNLQLGPLTQTTWVRRVTTSTVNTPNFSVCNSDPTNVVEITVQEPVTAGQIVGNQPICYGEIPDLIISQLDGTGSGPISYIWQASTTSATEDFIDISGENNQDYQPGPLTQTTWFRRITVSIVDGVACPSAPTDAVVISVAPELSISASVTKRVTCHDDSDGEITVSASGGWEGYEYSIDGIDYVSNNVFVGLPPRSYTILVRDVNGCEMSTIVTIENPVTLTLNISQTANIRCKGDTNAEVTLSGQGGWGNFTFSNDGTIYTGNTTFGNLAAGSYTFYVSDEEGCWSSEEIEIDEPNQDLEGSIVSVVNAICYGDANGQATVAGLEGWDNYSYSWNTQPVQNSPTATSLGAGSYTATITDQHGCTVQVDIEITQPEPVMITNIEVEHVHCKRVDEGGAIYFDVEGGAVLPVTYLWSNGETGDFLELIQQGTYSVVVTDANGCNAEIGFEVQFLDEDCIVRIPEGFSPDGDGINDNWVIKNLLEEHPNNIVKVFNRQGTLVFEAEQYNDNWDGTPNRGNVLVGRDGKVPQGVYYYLIWLDPLDVPLTGFIMVSY